MKAERRHQLQANELARQLETFPETLKRNANKIILAVTVVVVIVFVIRYRAQQQQQRISELSSAMSMIHQGPIGLKQLEMMTGPEDQILRRRQQLIADTNNSIETVLRDADGDYAAAMRAEALIAKGDLNWTLANLATTAGAASQPSTQPTTQSTTRATSTQPGGQLAPRFTRTPDEHLKIAADAYSDVVRGYSSQVIPWVTAQFGLGAIAENHRDWPKAREIYAAISARNEVPDVFKTEANIRLNVVLPMIQSPMFVGTYGTPIVPLPTTQSATQSTSAPTPTTRPDDSFTLTPATPASPAATTQP